MAMHFRGNGSAWGWRRFYVEEEKILTEVLGLSDLKLFSSGVAKHVTECLGFGAKQNWV